jgi:hypothetical protein
LFSHKIGSPSHFRNDHVPALDNCIDRHILVKKA